MAENEAATTAETPVAISREERHSTDYAADRITGLLSGAETPTEEPGDEPSAPSVQAAEEVSAEEVGAEQPETETATSESDDAPTEPEDKPELPSTIEELAQAFEAEPERFNDLKVKAKIDGEDVEVTLSEALAGYQRTADYTRKTTELSEQRQHFESAVTEAEAELRTRAQSLASRTLALKSLVVGKEPNWSALLNDPDPRKYQQAKHRWEAANQAFTQAEQTARAELQRVQAQQQEQFTKHLQTEHQKMVTTWPELADPSGPQANQIRSYLKERGFSEQDINGIADSRMIGVVLDAIKAHAVNAAQPSKKLVKPKPTRTVKPSAPATGADAKADKLAAARRNARRNPKDMRAAGDRILAILGD